MVVKNEVFSEIIENFCGTLEETTGDLIDLYGLRALLLERVNKIAPEALVIVNDAIDYCIEKLTTGSDLASL